MNVFSRKRFTEELKIMTRIYADNAATTKISQTAMKAMLQAMENTYGNPSSLHQAGMEANDAIQNARETIARCLGCTPKEIFLLPVEQSRINQLFYLLPYQEPKE